MQKEKERLKQPLLCCLYLAVFNKLLGYLIVAEHDLRIVITDEFMGDLACFLIPCIFIYFRLAIVFAVSENESVVIFGD